MSKTPIEVFALEIKGIWYICRKPGSHIFFYCEGYGGSFQRIDHISKIPEDAVTFASREEIAQLVPTKTFENTEWVLIEPPE